MKGVFIGKVYVKVFFFFKVVCEVMKRLLMGCFCGEESSCIFEFVIFFNFLKFCSWENFDVVFEEFLC